MMNEEELKNDNDDIGNRILGVLQDAAHKGQIAEGMVISAFVVFEVMTPEGGSTVGINMTDVRYTVNMGLIQLGQAILIANMGEPRPTDD